MLQNQEKLLQVMRSFSISSKTNKAGFLVGSLHRPMCLYTSPPTILHSTSHPFGQAKGSTRGCAHSALSGHLKATLFLPFPQESITWA